MTRFSDQLNDMNLPIEERMHLHSLDAQNRMSYIPGRATAGELEAAAISRIGDPVRSRATYGPHGLRRLTPSAQLEREAERGRQYAYESFITLLERALFLDGVEAHGGNMGRQLWRFFSQGERSASNAALLLNNTIGSALLAGFDEVLDSTLDWTTETENLTLLQEPHNRLSGTTLESVPRGGQAPHANFSESGELTQVYRYSSQFEVDEQDLIDGAANDLPRVIKEAFGVAAKNTKLDAIYATLLENPTMADGVALFHADHGNLLTGAALTDGNLTTAMSKLSQQTENGVRLNLPAKYLLAPTELARPAGKLIKDVYTGDRDATPPPIVRTDSRLSLGVTNPRTKVFVAGSATSWYLASGTHGIEVSFLKGFGKLPNIRINFLTRGSFGINIDVEYFVGVTPIDYHGLLRADA